MFEEKVLKEKVLRVKESSIPKVIHYVWLGGNKKSILIEKCMASWKKYCRGYEIIEWNESNFDIESMPKFIRALYKKKLWAFVSDYIRVKVLHEHGGIYLDTDMELIRPLNDLLTYDFFAGEEAPKQINVAIVGCKKHSLLIEKVLNYYQRKYKQIENIPVVVQKVYDECQAKDNIKETVKIFPREYFYPFYYNEKFSKECITKNTYAIHWWDHSWKDDDLNVVSKGFLAKKKLITISFFIKKVLLEKILRPILVKLGLLQVAKKLYNRIF